MKNDIFPQVVIISVLYNSKSQLKGFFASLDDLDYPKDKLRLVLVDNASTDGSQALLRNGTVDFSCEIIHSERNMGFAAANNRALARAQGEFAALLNPDTRVRPEWLKELVKAMRADAAIGIAGSRQVPKESGRRIDHSAGLVSWCCGGHCLIRLEALRKVGYFDERFFMYSEDVDLSWRMWLAGYRCAYVDSSVCEHPYEGRQSNIFRRTYYHVRNGILLRYKYGTPGEIAGGYLKWSIEAFSRLRRRKQARQLLAILFGLVGHICFIPYFAGMRRAVFGNDSFKKLKKEWITF
jgi:GT2 family glycosyltransferase